MKFKLKYRRKINYMLKKSKNLRKHIEKILYLR
jgi:hypothetical protein